MHAILYTKSICPYCHMAKDYLLKHNIRYEETLYDDYHERQQMYDRLGLEGVRRSVPQIFLVEGSEQRRIGGYSDLLQSDIAECLAVGDFSEEF